MNRILITISIPIYNCEKHIVNCLQSVVNQSYKNIEVILVDDLGKDNSIDLAKTFFEAHPDIEVKIIQNEKNAGLSVVRNVGIHHARGKYIFFLDSDDEITSDCIEKMVKIAEREQVEMVCGNTRSIYLESGKEIQAFRIKEENQKRTNNQEIFNDFIKGAFPVPSWNKLILVDFLRKNNLYFKEGLYAQDSLQSFETALVLNSVYYLKDDTYIYYLHQDSVIHNRTKKHFDNWITILKEFEKYYNKEEDRKRKNSILSYMIDYKALTLQMNWKAQKDETLWKYSYTAYQKIASLSFWDYFKSTFSRETKKQNFLQNLSINLGYKVFRKRYGD